MVKLYKSLNTGKIHLVQGGYICNHALGKMTEQFPDQIFEGTRDDITCKNCRQRLN